MQLKQLIILFTFTHFVSCSQLKTPEAWLSDNTVELEAEKGYNFSTLKEVIGNKRIVAIGESTHGSGTFYKLKSELVIYLHEEMGFEVLAMESGLGDTHLAYSNIDSLTSHELRDHSVFGNFRANEATKLFKHIKTARQSKKPLLYTGYDTQASSEYLYSKLSLILQDYDTELADSLSTRMRSYQKSYGFGQNGDSIKYAHYRDIFVTTANKTKDYLTKNKAEIISKHKLKQIDFDVMVRSLSMFAASYNLPYYKRYEGHGLRDQFMAENLIWFLEEIYPNKKFIVWAHNAHIENSSLIGRNTKWMGHFLKEKYQDDYYSIGLFANSGEMYQFWTDATIPIENKDASFAEHRMIATEKQTPFLNLNGISESPSTQWLFEPINGFELENGGIVSFRTQNRFDGLIVVKESKAPNYD